MKKTYYGYTRVSTVKQGDGVSLEAQKEAIERYASQHSLIVSHWLEEKETAAKLGRPIFTQMIKDLHANKADGVIMHKIDRSARNLRDWATVGELQDAGIDVHFAAESVDFASRGGRLTADIQAVISADYIRNLREETIKGINGRLKQGLYPFKAPIGYLDKGGGKVKTIDPVRGPLVKQVFELYNTGQYSFASLAEEMNKRGLRGRLGKRVYKGKIERILSNPFYMGTIEVLTTGAIYAGIHEPLISATLFRSVQERRVGRANKKKTKHDFLYRGLFKCIDCKNSMIPEKQRGNVYYRCHTPDCTTTTVREDVLETCITEKLQLLEIMPETANQFISNLSAGLLTHTTQPHRDTGAIEKAKLNTQNNNLLNALLKGTIDDETYKSKLKELKIAEMSLKEESERRSTSTLNRRYYAKFLEHAQNLANTYVSALKHEKRQLVELCFSNKSISGRTPLFEPRMWLVEAVNLSNGPYGGLYDATNRSGSQFPEPVTNSHITELVDADFCKFVDLCHDIIERARLAKIQELTNQELSSAA
jgi:DNA invertase Pin-like site-specific DNA recombinase